MAKDGYASQGKDNQGNISNEDVRSLLSESSVSNEGPPLANVKQHRRQSSLAQSRPDGAPRTVNRVRFEVDDSHKSEVRRSGRIDSWIDEEDYWSNNVSNEPYEGDNSSQRLPLLTDLEAPSVALASEDNDSNPEYPTEIAGAKSGMRSAFMNMANSIM